MVVADEEALRAFLEGPYVRILRSVTLICDSHAEAQDAVHEAIARGWERRAKIEHLDRWVLTVAMNVVRSRWRRTLRATPRVPWLSSAASTDDGSTVEWSLLLRQLPLRQRQVAVLHYVEDLSVAAIAELTGTTEGAVKNALFHARAALAAALERAEIQEPTS